MLNTKKSEMYFIPINRSVIAPNSGKNLVKAMNVKREPRCFLEVMMPFLIFMRLIGRFPYFLEGKNVRCKFFSFWTFYTGTILILSTYLQATSTFKDDIYVTVVRDNLIRGIFVIMGLAHIITPFSVWFEVPWMVQYFNKWGKFEDSLAEVDVYLPSNMQLLVRLWTVLFLPLAAILASLDCYFHRNFYYIPALLLVYSSTVSTLVIWIFICSFIRMASGVLHIHLKQVLFRRYVARDEIAKCRILWLMLSETCKSLGCAFGPTFMFFITQCSLICITTAYALVIIAREGFKHSIFFIATVTSIFVLSISILLAICEIGQRCSNRVGEEFIKTLIEQDYTKFDKDAEMELNMFLKSISSEYPRIVLSGYVAVNRSLFISLLSASVTYLIVLVQFRTSEENSKDFNATATFVEPKFS